MRITAACQKYGVDSGHLRAKLAEVREGTNTEMFDPTLSDTIIVEVQPGQETEEGQTAAFKRAFKSKRDRRYQVEAFEAAIADVRAGETLFFGESKRPLAKF